MFWGNGDTSKLDAAQRKTLEEIRRLVETGHVIALNPEQSAVAVQAINFYAQVQAATSLLKAIRNILLLVGAIIGIWWASHDFIVSFIQKAVAP